MRVRIKERMKEVLERLDPVQFEAFESIIYVLLLLSNHLARKSQGFDSLGQGHDYVALLLWVNPHCQKISHFL